MTRLLAVALLALPAVAAAQVDAQCAGLPKPADYSEELQQDFLQNYFGLGSTYSAIHAPIPHEPGHGSIGVDLNVLPPLGCRRRMVLDWTKTEHTNKTPVLPRPRVSFAFPAIGKLVPYASFAYVPPIDLGGTRTVVLSGEIGAGMALGEAEKLQVGARFHATSMKAIADIAGAFSSSEPDVLDYYQANSLGLDLSAGYDLGAVTPYVSAGVVDVSSIFLVGDDGILVNNYHPYAGPAFGLGADGLVGARFRWGAELYAAPGGHSRPAEEAVQAGFGEAGHLYTARLRVAVEL